jgi:predicted DNA-binding transcriptional regulator AlpA
MDPLQEELLTSDESAHVLRLSPSTMEAWRLRGKGPKFLKLGRRVLYKRSSLEEFMAERERASTSDRGK